MGKIEGEGENYHGHITAVTVAVDFRRQGVAKMLMNKFEQVCIENDCYFIDLYVRISNKVAVEMYTKMGYVVYQQIIEYYSGEDAEDAYGLFWILYLLLVFYFYRHAQSTSERC